MVTSKRVEMMDVFQFFMELWEGVSQWVTQVIDMDALSKLLDNDPKPGYPKCPYEPF